MKQLLLPGLLALGLSLPPLLHADTSCQVSSVNELRTSDADQGEMRISLTFSDPRLVDALEYGNWKLSKAVDDTGVFLHTDDNDEDVFRPIRTASSGAAAQEPIATMDLRLTLPARSAKKISELAGTVIVRTYSKQVVWITDILEKTDQDLPDKLFEAHEITVRSVDPRQGIPGVPDGRAAEELRRRAVSIRVEGDIDQVRGIELVDANNKPLPSRASEFGAGKSILFTRVSDTDLPPGTGVRIIIPTSPQDVELPFSLSSIALP